MTSSVLRLYPQPSLEEPLEGLYLGHDLRAAAPTEHKAYVYSNYVTSLDGRIAVPHPSKPGLVVPDNVANARDWRLFQELAVQADVLITSGRYLRDYAEGRAQEILTVYNEPRFADLVSWRKQRGLSARPDMAVISGSLDFPIPSALTQDGRRVSVVTTRSADPERVKVIQDQAGSVLFAGDTTVTGESLVEALMSAGYRIIYNTSGPKVLRLLLASGMLQRLYLTTTSRILGGSPFSSIVEGDLLQPALDFKLNSLYYDAHAPDGASQLFSSYDSV